MRVIETELTNKVFTGDDCYDMPATVHRHPWESGTAKTIETCWELTPEELETVARTGKIYLNVIGREPQPCLITVESIVIKE